MLNEGTPLKGKIAVVTGASRGIGKQIAYILGKEGATVVLVSRSSSTLKELAHNFEMEGIRAEPFVCDVRSEEQVQRFQEEIIRRFSRVHILVNNAGINIRHPITEFPLADWHQVIETNLTGAFLMSRALVPYMKGQGYGRIINISSILAHVGLAGRTAYAASKAGLIGFTKALAIELAPEQITVNAICPGPVATSINEVILKDEKLKAEFTLKIPLGRWGKEEEIAYLVLYLCLPQASWITGTTILIDGGWTAQ